MKLDHFDKPSATPHKIVEYYPNDGQAVKENGYYTYIQYSNGDRIWLKVVDGEYQVTMVMDHNDKIHTGFTKHPFGDPK